MRLVIGVLFTLLLLSTVNADCYMHSLRGSNNRLRGNGQNTQNANRLFDSQNNNKGGYCWGPQMTLYENSYLQVEWTSQHGCGSSHGKVDCDIILQYMCGKDVRDGNGETTDTITENTYLQKDGNGEYVYGMHESYANYRKCARRRRNYGLFYADQNNPQADRPALYTRQGNDATKYGFECPEERDYYPYWHPTPWKDIAIFTSRPERCAYFEKESQNQMDKWWCEDPGNLEETEIHNNPKSCGEHWVKVEAWNLPVPYCHAAGWNRDNHLGSALGGHTNTYKWILPSFAQMGEEDVIPDPRDGEEGDVAPCVLRIRYNISTGDFPGGVENEPRVLGDEGFTDSDDNGDASPVKQDPYINFYQLPNSADLDWHLRLALDTSQFARTFEDRSHTFYLKEMPAGKSCNVYNLMVRGKRGNIVQTYPAVEYDFTPNTLNVAPGECVHMQWTGCDTNPGGNAGEGRSGTDRSNIVQLTTNPDQPLHPAGTNYPLTLEESTIFGPANTPDTLDKAFTHAFINQYDHNQCSSVDETNCCYTYEQLTEKLGNNRGNWQQDPQNCFVLNSLDSAHFDGGLTVMSVEGTYHYMSSRNNNFSNRSQKGTINVQGRLSPLTLTATIAGAVGFGAAAVIAGGSYAASSGSAGGATNCFAGLKA